MKCTVCGFEVKKLDYGRLRLQKVTKVNVLGEHIKNKETTLDLILCNSCRDRIQADLITKAIQEGNYQATEDVMHIKAGFNDPEIDAVLKKHTPKEEGSCNGDCASCDGDR